MRLKNLFKSEIVKEKIDKEVVIYGAGNFARKCYKVLKIHNIKVAFFIDKDTQYKGVFIEDIPIITIEDERIKEINENITCIIGIFNAYVDLKELEFQLKRTFFSIINPLQFFNYFSDDFGSYFFLTKGENYLKEEKKFQDVYSLLEDEISKNLFKDILEFRYSSKFKNLPKPQDLNFEYFPDDIPLKYPEKIEFLDCGAYIGDTILKIIQKGLPLSSFIAFEPDIENIKKLYTNLSDLTRYSGNIYPCGVWSETTQIYFNSGKDGASNIDLKGDTLIQTVCIDEVLINKNINFIKMDIEGAEIEALKGAKKLICKYKPILAIASYHKYDDLYTIPKLINSWELNYKFYLRMYEYNSFGIVYYAIPKKYLKESNI